MKLLNWSFFSTFKKVSKIYDSIIIIEKKKKKKNIFFFLIYI